MEFIESLTGWCPTNSTMAISQKKVKEFSSCSVHEVDASSGL